MSTMAEVMGKALLDVHLLSGGDASYEEMALEVSDALRAAGFGHVPTALNEAADALAFTEAILSLLRYRGIINSERNREDVARALVEVESVRARARAAETGATP